MKGIIDFDPSYREEDPVTILVDAGVPASEAEWLAGLMLDPKAEFFAPDEHYDDIFIDRVRTVATAVGSIFQSHPDEPAAGIVHALMAIQGYSSDLRRTADVQASPGTLIQKEWEKRWQARPLAWAKGFVGIWKQDHTALHPAFVSNLLLRLDTEATMLFEVIDLAALQLIGQNPDMSLDSDDPHRLEFWAAHLPLGTQANGGPGILTSLQPRFESESRGTEGAIIGGLLRVMEFGISKYMFNPLGCILASLLPYIRVINDRLREAPSDLGLRRAHMRLALQVLRLGRGVQNGPVNLDDTDREALIASARDYLGRLRPRLRDEFVADEPNLLEVDLLCASVKVLAALDSPWSALKRLLLLLSSLRTPSVASDLRYWNERDAEPPPKPWSVIPEQIAAIIHSLPSDEPDPTLVGIREDFARFALDRLKTRDGVDPDKPVFEDQDFVEDRPEWRDCYVRAIRELRSNPRGKGHHVLLWVSQHDPHLEVREHARIAHKELRHGVELAPDTSPRAALFAAFWWLRQAHLASVGGVEIDPRGAQRTRAKEVRRTSLKVR